LKGANANVKKNLKISASANHRGEIIKLIKNLSHKHSTWRVFEDFLGMAAISISNAVDWIHRNEREAMYMEIVGRYEKKEVDLFPQMLAHLTEELERHVESPHDVLGEIFHELELHNRYRGQFFTPQNICDMMGMMSIGAGDLGIAERGFVTVGEPCCGSGAMILGFAKAMMIRGYDYRRQMVVTATDVDIKCVYMCYLQLSLYGIPAVIIHGNSLTMQEYSRWYTPVYMLDGWVWKQTCGNIEKRYPEDEAIKQSGDPIYSAILKVSSATNTKEAPLVLKLVEQ
jgi:type I restriction-modification system DNA methylase subunit